MNEVALYSGVSHCHIHAQFNASVVLCKSIYRIEHSNFYFYTQYYSYTILCDTI